MAQMQCGFTASLPNEVSIVGETGYIKVSRPVQAPEAYTIVTRQGEEPDPMLMRGQVSTVATPLDPPHSGLAPGYNFVGSQGFVYEATAVQVERAAHIDPSPRPIPSAVPLLAFPTHVTAPQRSLDLT